MAPSAGPALPAQTAEIRGLRGEWRPARPVAMAPLFAWPWRPGAVLRWLFGYPGFLAPSNALLLAISTASYFLTQPALERCRTFQAGWMAQIYLRNQALIWIYYGAFYLWLYRLRGEGTRTKYDGRWPSRDSGLFLFRDQVKDNVFWTAGVAGLVWTAYEWATMWMYANGRIPFLRFGDHPVWFVGCFLLIPLWREFHFYWVHRLIHLGPLFRAVHYLHHKNVNPNPWSGMAMHPVETVLYLSVCLIHWVVPSHPFHFLFDLQHAGLAPAAGHDGFDGPLLRGTLPVGSYFHYLHHRYFECNYGESTLPLDRWFGTFRDGRAESVPPRRLDPR
ncbi:MAG TPA: sterol desaturase family protein [Anaeromyxobacter sp.]|nr:sterol desaturase family protein [Anaeromyxobacter sp.]